MTETNSTHKIDIPFVIVDELCVWAVGNAFVRPGVGAGDVISEVIPVFVMAVFREPYVS